MSQAAHTNSPDPQADAHLAGLHKMSTTAGVTNSDYTAVSHFAIAAVLLGLLSGLAFLSLVMLVIPLVGVIVSAAALRQIRDSAGTQTGKSMAMLGMLLSLGCALGAAGIEYRQYASVQDDSRGIAQTLSTVGENIRKGDFAAAYKLFDDDFHNRVKFEKFKSTWELAQQDDRWGAMELMEWNKVTPSFESQAGSKTADVLARIKFKRVGEERYGVRLRKVGDRWLISLLPTFFPEQTPQPKRPAKDDGFNL